MHPRHLTLLALAAPLPASAATLTTPSGAYPTIQSAIDAAISGDVIDILAGVHTEDLSVVAKDITLLGAGVESTELRSAGGTAVLTSTGSGITVRGLAINGLNQSQAISLTGATDVFVREVDLFDTNSVLPGGALSIFGADSVDVLDSTVRSSTSSSDGGGIYAFGVTSLTVSRSVFCSDNAVADGDAIYATGSAGQLRNNVFVDHTGGSAVYLADGDWEVHHNAFVANAGTALEQPDGNLGFTHNIADGNNVALNAVLADGVVRSNNAFGSNGDDVAGGYPDPTSLTGFFPDFRIYPAHTCQLDDFLVEWDSALIDAGSGNTDRDNSTTDIGPSGGPDSPSDWFASGDGDPAPLLTDCDDEDPANYPGNTETCAVPGDNDCDGLADIDDLDTTDTTTYGLDQDGDGVGSGLNGEFVVACTNPDPKLYVDSAADCDDNNPYRYPGADELCFDGVDNNCDPLIDDPSSVDATDWYADADGDGFGEQGTNPTRSCTEPSTNPYIYPYATESGDCAATDPDVYPTAPEICDGIDNDCIFGEYYAIDAPTWVPDADGDGYAGEGKAGQIVVCDPPGKEYIDLEDSLGDDCNEANPDINPAATEICDGLDNDCNWEYDDLPGTPSTVYDDLDEDGYGAGDPVLTHCPSAAHAAQDGDCDDDDAQRNPGLSELCDGIDNDCSGVADDGPLTTHYSDFDGDGFGAPDSGVDAMCAPDGTVTNDLDCVDGIAEINPDAEEIPGNTVDEDCDGTAQGASTGSDGVKPNKGCQCSSEAGAGAGWALGVSLLAVGWRRRRA